MRKFYPLAIILIIITPFLFGSNVMAETGDCTVTYEEFNDLMVETYGRGNLNQSSWNNLVAAIENNPNMKIATTTWLQSNRYLILLGENMVIDSDGNIITGSPYRYIYSNTNGGATNNTSDNISSNYNNLYFGDLNDFNNYFKI